MRKWLSRRANVFHLNLWPNKCWLRTHPVPSPGRHKRSRVSPTESGQLRRSLAWGPLPFPKFRNCVKCPRLPNPFTDTSAAQVQMAPFPRSLLVGNWPCLSRTFWKTKGCWRHRCLSWRGWTPRVIRVYCISDKKIHSEVSPKCFLWPTMASNRKSQSNAEGLEGRERRRKTGKEKPSNHCAVQAFWERRWPCPAAMPVRRAHTLWVCHALTSSVHCLLFPCIYPCVLPPFSFQCEALTK